MPLFYYHILQSVGILLILLLIRYLVVRLVIKRFLKANFDITRKQIVIKLVNIFFFVILAFFLAAIWGLSGAEVFTYVTSALTILGVAFFAQWSLLSNITSGLILFFNHPLKIGDFVEIIDKDFPMEGRVENITLFFLHLRNKDDQVYTLSNTVVVQKTMRILKPEEFFEHQRQSRNKEISEENIL
ncbi:mechanosensitive ion channel domain-containing protein [Flavimarina sp. Hel_I_48]|uniref:mechanosensitive ion channel domain-containing protein n=1 Tax=Flavimarina sp. Hel_I_48 TaxID=1392488 RepID=UPI000AE8A790|nr:mechanosensitive ion channel domain-containing protein [Flavimarina sp. Hel_I_48]